MKVLISLLAVCFFVSGCCIFKPPKRWAKECQPQTEISSAVKETTGAQVEEQKSTPAVAAPAATAPAATVDAAPAVEQVKGEIVAEETKPAAVVEEKKPEIIKGEVVE